MKVNTLLLSSLLLSGIALFEDIAAADESDFSKPSEQSEAPTDCGAFCDTYTLSVCCYKTSQQKPEDCVAVSLTCAASMSADACMKANGLPRDKNYVSCKTR